MVHDGALGRPHIAGASAASTLGTHVAADKQIGACSVHARLYKIRPGSRACQGEAGAECGPQWPLSREPAALGAQIPLWARRERRGRSSVARSPPHPRRCRTSRLAHRCNGPMCIIAPPMGTLHRFGASRAPLQHRCFAPILLYPSNLRRRAHFSDRRRGRLVRAQRRLWNRHAHPGDPTSPARRVGAQKCEDIV